MHESKYNGISKEYDKHYDAEQYHEEERQLVAMLSEIIQPHHTVLDIGFGT